MTPKEKLIFAIGAHYVINFKNHTELEMQESALKLKSMLAPEMKNQEVDTMLAEMEIMRKELITIMRNFDSVGRDSVDR